MAPSATSAHPIRTLREYVTALEAAITLCLADPAVKSVHRLRTTTRRIEGQFALLAVLPGVPEHHKLASKARKLLKKLRRAAGTVRDLDVQLDLIDTVTPEKPSPSFERDAELLRTSFEGQRGKAADKLLKKLGRHQSDATVALESLLEALGPVNGIALSPTELTTVARKWYIDNLPPDPEKNPDDPEHLHSIRKNAKLARYIAENAPRSAKTPRKLAASFEAIQEAGGHWHDWLVLADIAADEVGRSSPLTEAFTHRCRIALTVYRRHLLEAAS